MDKIIKIENKNIINALEKYHYDFQSRKNIIEYILIHYPNLDNALWEEYQ